MEDVDIFIAVLSNRVYFVAIGIFYGHLVYFMANKYIWVYFLVYFFILGILYRVKSGNPACL
jgi:uncharacterized membrane protein YgaE (UPF0421/DUF939 family)